LRKLLEPKGKLIERALHNLKGRGFDVDQAK